MQRSNMVSYRFFMWLLVSYQTAMNIQWCVLAVPKTIQQVLVQCPVSSLHRTSVSRKDTFLTHIATTSFPSCPTERHEAISEDTQDGWSLTDYGLKEDGKQRTWYGSCWLGCHNEKCLEKRHDSPARLLCKHCLYLPSCFPLCCYITLFVVTFLHSLNIILLWSSVYCLVVLNRIQTAVWPKADTHVLVSRWS